MHVIFAFLLACGGASETPSPEAGSAPAPQAASAPAQPQAAIRDGEMNVHALQQRIGKETAVVVDVRTPGEFAQGHVPGAVNIPLQELKARAGELEAYRGQEIAVICAVGGRSATATSFLATEGWPQVYNVQGGTRAWVEAGYPTE